MRPRENFSLQYQYKITKKRKENKETNKLTDD